MPFSSTVIADRRTRCGAGVISGGTTETSTRAVAVAPTPLSTVYSIGGRPPVTPGAGVTWIALPPATIATCPDSGDSGVTALITTLVQSTLGSLSSTRSTVARSARTPNSSSAADGAPIGTAVQSGGSRGSSEVVVGSSTVAESSTDGSGGATSAQLSTGRKPASAIHDRPVR